MNLSEKHITLISDILKKHFSGCKVFAYGSRVTGKNKRYSDLDLAVECNATPLPILKIADAKQDFMESDLPFSVDIVDLNRLNDKFRSVIESEAISWPQELTTISI